MTTRQQMAVTDPQRTAPRWLADYKDRTFVVPGGTQIDRTRYHSRDAVRVVVGTGGAAQNAASVPVAAPGLPSDIKNGTTVDFGSGKFARLTADALAGAVTLSTAAIPTALLAGDVGYTPGFQAVEVLSGTVVSRSAAEAASRAPFHPPTDADANDPQADVRFIVYDVVDARVDDDIVLLRPGATVRKNYLPDDFTTLSAAVQARLARDYVLILGEG